MGLYRNSAASSGMRTLSEAIERSQIRGPQRDGQGGFFSITIRYDPYVP
jgi:hypothetical protein